MSRVAIVSVLLTSLPPVRSVIHWPEVQKRSEEERGKEGEEGLERERRGEGEGEGEGEGGRDINQGLYL